MKYNYFIKETWRGYIAGYSYKNKYRTVNIYLSRIYNGVPSFTIDYLHARYYKTKKAAAAAVELIREAIGEC